ncbi:MAG: maltose ABC transporter permease MalF [Acidimicrobiia bacterium]|nr:maltose ABC transporter permease MalF [Acidimicrobiia bacterium]NNF11442.1 maltose ABC transporter permease MalF [Acidimicrobiia bacterium]
MTGTDVQQETRRDQPRRVSFTLGFGAKLLFLAVVNGFAVFGLPRMIEEKAWLFAVFTVVATLAIDWIYLSSKGSTLPLKYLIPGTILLLVFQVWPVLNTAYIAFTNLGTGNILTFDQALDQILEGSTFPTDDDPRLDARPLGILEDEEITEIALYLVDEEGMQFLGTVDGLEEVTDEDLVVEEDRVVAVGDYVVLGLAQVSPIQEEFTALEIPAGDNRLIKLTRGVSGASLVSPSLDYDSDTGTLTDVTTGIVYEQVEGTFTAPTGETITPGWRAVIGFDNFTKVFTNENIRGPFLRVFIWTFVFAIGSVFLTFVVGLGLAITLNQPDMKGQRFYRSLMVIPYALPSFLSALIWAGLLNQEFGVINEFLNLDVPWLRDQWWAKGSTLLVNTWLGFPYMFLISTGALQAIPDNLKEAASIDGATSRQSFRLVTLPLLLVSLAPLLIASFAFNFNNFNTIFLLTGGGPPIQGAQTPAGHTDILISYTYRLAFESGRGADFGLAAGIGILIFMIVATISAISFKRTAVFEELNQ